MPLLQNFDLQLLQFVIKKIPAVCIIGLKRNEPLREALKMNLDDRCEN